MRRFSLSFLILTVLVFLVQGCGNGGSGGGGTTSPTISGKVADGYVKNASVYVYSDQEMSTLIGSGQTDDNGEFSITLIVSTIPDTLYIKSVGGIVIDTGLPAPTMLFVGSGTGSTFNITPLTDSLFKYHLTMGLDTAESYLSGKLGITPSDLYGDPVTNQNLQNSLYQILSSGTGGGTLPDGDYRAVVIYLDEEDINNNTYSSISDIETKNKVELDITISNGDVSGTMVGTQEVVTGRVQGSSILLNILDNPDNPTSLTRVAGSIGFLGSVAGTYVNFSVAGAPDNPAFTLTKGVYVASFIPSTGLDPQRVATVVENIFIGQRHGLFCDINNLFWGDINITDVDFTNSTVTAGDTTAYVDQGSGSNTPENVVMFFTEGKLIKSSDGLPANIAILHYFIEGEVYIIQPVGIRRGIFLVVGDNNIAKDIGVAYMSKDTNIAPSLDPDMTYKVSVAVAHPGLLGQTRDTSEMFFTGDTFTTPADMTTTPYDLSGGELKVFNGSMIAFLRDGDNDGLRDGFVGSDDNNGQHDYLRVVELLETGAMEGEEMIGGTITDPFSGTSMPMNKFPATFVGYVRKQASTAPSFGGTLNFLTRVLYTTDPESYVNAYITGTLTISGTTATLSWTTAIGDSGEATITAENSGGVYHLHGQLDPNSYIDIYWPVGGKKATYVVSDKADGTGNVTEVGEAYITF